MDPAARMVLAFLGSYVSELPRYSKALVLSPILRNKSPTVVRSSGFSIHKEYRLGLVFTWVGLRMMMI